MPSTVANRSTIQTFQHPFVYRLVQGFARLAEFFPGHFRPDAEWLERQALRITGQDCFADTSFREPLRILLKSVREQGELNAIGRAVVSLTGLTCLVNRLTFEQLWGGARPKTADPDWPLRSPLYIVGLPRTGTTLLHKLLSADPRARPLLFWEAMFPRRLPEKRADAASTAMRQSRAKQTIQMLNRLSPGLPGIHDIDPTGPEECYLLLANTFHSFSFPLQWPVRDYYDWLSARSSADWFACYQYYVDSLRVLSTGTSDRHWVLKCPFHAPRVDALAQLIPNAIFIQTYRDLREVVASTCSLSAALRAVVTDQWNPAQMGGEVLETLGTYSRESMAASARHSSRVISIHYRELVHDPLGTVRRVYERVGLPWDETVETPMRGWLAANPQGKHGRHKYALEDFGLTADQVAKTCPEYMEIERRLSPG